MATDERTDVRPRPDASMSMLNDLFDHRVEDDYLAARRLRGSPHVARPRLPAAFARRVAFFLVIVVCAVFATSGVRQLLRPDQQQSADHDALVREAQARSGDVDGLERQLVRTRTEYAAAQRAALAKDAQGAAEVRRLEALQNSTGFNAVHGAGVVVTVDDAQDGDLTGDASGGRILDRDLQILVNGLWAAGATAVAINGQRLTTLTAIREAGDAVLVDFRPLARPYVVSALGDRHTLEARFADGPAGRYFKTLQTSFDVSFDMDDRDTLTLPAASTVTLQYAHKENP
ncbi:MAG: DUF881 domain-containing protein [Streptosporangiales bacterium]|nr:DUF881 domain-containing protein [Streptosporangiales bacterium]MBO0890408.1 DUF881 domain-containing protein [Acidothermales bacterium]